MLEGNKVHIQMPIAKIVLLFFHVYEKTPNSLLRYGIKNAFYLSIFNVQ